MISRIWWSLALRGVVAILFGLVALLFPPIALLTQVSLFGAFAIISGTGAIVAAVRAGEGHARWGWLALVGMVGVTFGLLSIIWPGITALIFVDLVAIWAIISGITEMAFALQTPDTLAHPVQVSFAGALSVVFGLVLAIWPKSGAVTLTWLIGIYSLLYGATSLYYAFRLQALRHEVQSLNHLGQRFAADRG